MVEFKVVINDVKTGKSYQKIVNDASLIGKKVKDKFDGKLVGLQGYELEITGGSDSAGFPMRRDVETSGRKKLLLTKGPAVHIVSKGMKKRKTVRGNTISEQIHQINAKIVNYGPISIEELFGVKEEVSEKAEDKAKEEVKKEKPKKEKKAKEEEK